MRIIKSGDGRYRTEAYSSKNGENFAVFEKIVNGTVATEFSMDGDVVDQIYYRSNDPVECIKGFFANREIVSEIKIDEYERYDPVEVRGVCPSCGKKSLCRELDLVEPSMIKNVPVIPLYVCKSCGKKYYSLNDAYLEKLIDRNRELFSEEETAELEKDRMETAKTIQEYVLRIFASKKISRLKIGSK